MNVDNIRRITVIGAGRMGHGIGQEFALAGYEVYFFGRSEERLQQAKERVERNLRELTELGEKTGKGFYEWTPQSTEAWRKKIEKNLIRFLLEGKE